MHTRNISWASVVDVVVLHAGFVGLVVCICVRKRFDYYASRWCGILLGGLGVTVGAHRYSHQAFVPRTPCVRTGDTLASTGRGTRCATGQPGICSISNSDGRKDPSGRWLLAAHMGWMTKRLC